MKRMGRFLLMMIVIGGGIAYAASIGSAAVATFICHSASCRDMASGAGHAVYTLSFTLLVGALLWASWPRV